MEDNNKVEEDVLLKIISKAELNGFSFKKDDKIKKISFIGFGRFQLEFESENQNSIFEFHINELLFNHNFAKAFFGDSDTCSNCGHKLKGQDWKSNACGNCNKGLNEKEDDSWEYHLKQMVLSKNLLKYFVNLL